MMHQLPIPHHLNKGDELLKVWIINQSPVILFDAQHTSPEAWGQLIAILMIQLSNSVENIHNIDKKEFIYKLLNAITATIENPPNLSSGKYSPSGDN